jgi:CRISPR-associated protein Cas1
VIPSIGDRIVQSALGRILTPDLDPRMSAASFAYRPGRSPAMAAARIQRLHKEGFGYLVEGDIEHYFDSVDHHRLDAMLGASLADPRAGALIASWLAALAPDGQGLPQGRAGLAAAPEPLSARFPQHCDFGHARCALAQSQSFDQPNALEA